MKPSNFLPILLLLAGLPAQANDQQGPAATDQAVLGTTRVPVAQPSPGRGKRTPARVQFASCEKPVWPRQALREEQTGTVTLKFLIGVDGTVQDSQLDLTSGYPLLDFAAMEGIERCRFTPATVDGVPQAGWQRMQYVWTLEGDPQDDKSSLAKIQAGIEQGKPDARLQLALYQLRGGNSQVAKDGAEALKSLLPLAEEGMAAAQEALGVAYLSGSGTARDPVQAAKWLRKAAEHNYASAQYSLARLLQQGEGVPRDETQALEWYLRAARGGIQHAYVAMAEILLESGDAATMSRAVDGLKKMTLPAAQYMLGQCYEQGRGVAQDLARARDLYSLAASAGKSKARQALLRLDQ